SVEEALKHIQNDEFSTYPVTDDNHCFIGFFTEARLRRTAAEGGVAQRVEVIVQSSPHIQQEDILVRVVVKMERSGSRQFAVVEEKDGNKLIGLLTMSDIVRAHARAAIDAEEYDRPELSLSGSTAVEKGLQ